MRTTTGAIVVTGATGDIGRATRVRLEVDGYRTVGIDLTGDESDGLFLADLADPRAVSEVFSKIASENGRLFGLVNCAGVYEALDAATTTLADFERIWRGNVVTAWLTSQSFAEHALDGARIVNLGSISGQRGSLDVAYGAAKGGVLALTKSLALHLAPRIRVNAVAPGVVDGSWHRAFLTIVSRAIAPPSCCGVWDVPRRLRTRSHPSLDLRVRGQLGPSSKSTEELHEYRRPD